MKLDEFHVLQRSVGPVYHRHPVAGRHRRVGGDLVQLAGAAGGEKYVPGPDLGRARRPHCDDPDASARWLDDHRIPAQSRSRRLRLDRERELDALAWLIDAEGMAFEVTVLPLDGLRQAPLSAIDEKPMRRASLAQLRTLLAEDEIAGYEQAR